LDENSWTKDLLTAGNLGGAGKLQPYHDITGDD